MLNKAVITISLILIVQVDNKVVKKCFQNKYQCNEDSTGENKQRVTVHGNEWVGETKQVHEILNATRHDNMTHHIIDHFCKSFSLVGDSRTSNDSLGDEKKDLSSFRDTTGNISNSARSGSSLIHSLFVRSQSEGILDILVRERMLFYEGVNTYNELGISDTITGPRLAFTLNKDLINQFYESFFTLLGLGDRIRLVEANSATSCPTPNKKLLLYGGHCEMRGKYGVKPPLNCGQCASYSMGIMDGQTTWNATPACGYTYPLGRCTSNYAWCVAVGTSPLKHMVWVRSRTPNRADGDVSFNDYASYGFSKNPVIEQYSCSGSNTTTNASVQITPNWSLSPHTKLNILPVYAAEAQFRECMNRPKTCVFWDTPSNSDMSKCGPTTVAPGSEYYPNDGADIIHGSVATRKCIDKLAQECTCRKDNFMSKMDKHIVVGNEADFQSMEGCKELVDPKLAEQQMITGKVEARINCPSEYITTNITMKTTTTVGPLGRKKRQEYTTKEVTIEVLHPLRARNRKRRSFGVTGFCFIVCFGETSSGASVESVQKIENQLIDFIKVTNNNWKKQELNTAVQNQFNSHIQWEVSSMRDDLNVFIRKDYIDKNNLYSIANKQTMILGRNSAAISASIINQKIVQDLIYRWTGEKTKYVGYEGFKDTGDGCIEYDDGEVVTTPTIKAPTEVTYRTVNGKLQGNYTLNDETALQVEGSDSGVGTTWWMILIYCLIGVGVLIAIGCIYKCYCA